MGVVRKSKSVELLLREFDKSDTSLSAVQLIERFKEDLNKTTIYRALERLEEDGVLHSFVGADGIMWYAKCNEECSTENHNDSHPHFKCVSCGNVDCIAVELPLPEVPNRTVLSSQVLLQGLCEKCNLA